MRVAKPHARLSGALLAPFLVVCLTMMPLTTAWALPDRLPSEPVVDLQLRDGVPPLQLTESIPVTSDAAAQWRQSKAAAVVLGILAPGAGQAYAGRWDHAGGTVLWWGGGVVAYLLGVLAMFTGGEYGVAAGTIVGLAGLTTSAVFQVLGIIDAVTLVDQAAQVQP